MEGNFGGQEVAEREHHRSSSESVVDLVDHSKPTAYNGDVVGLREVPDGLEKIVLGFEASIGYSEPQIVDFLFPKLKFGWVKDHACPGAQR